MIIVLIKEKKKFAVYTRKSRFTGKGESIDHQKNQCLNKILEVHSDISENDIIYFEDEGFSGKNIKRPGFQKMKKMIENGEIAAVYVYSLDRLSRSISDFSTFYKLLKDHNISFVTVNVSFDTGTVSGETMLNMLTVFSEFERNIIAERIRDNMHELAKSGRWLGGTAPTGYVSCETEGSYALDGRVRKAFKLKKAEDELSTIRIIFDKYIEFASQNKLITYLMNEGYKTKNDIYFSRQAIKSILTNPVYAAADENMYDYFSCLGANICSRKDEFNGKYGIMAYNKTLQTDGKSNKKKSYSEWIVAVGKHEPIISSDQWLKVQKILRYRGKSCKSYPRTETALLSGLLYCGKCGKHMRPKVGAARKDGSKQFSYRCVLKQDSKKQLCTARNIDGNGIDSLISEKISELQKAFKIHASDIAVFKKRTDKSDIDLDAEIKKSEKGIAEKNKKIRNAAKQAAAYDISNPEDSAMIDIFKEQIKELIDDKAVLEARIRKLQAEKERSRDQLFCLEDFAESLILPCRDMSYGEKLKVIRSVVDFIVFYEDTNSADIIFKGCGITKEEYFSYLKPTGMDSKCYSVLTDTKDVQVAIKGTFTRIFGEKGSRFAIPVSDIIRLPMVNNAFLGSQIKYYRELKGITQEELGKAVGISKYTIRRIENQEMLLVNLPLLDKLITYLDIADKITYEDDYLRFIKNNPVSQIKAYRKKKNITMYQLSEILNTSYSTVKKWESGKQTISRKCYERLKKLLTSDVL